MFAYGTHAVVVAVDPDSGAVELLDYVVSEDCGTMINPMIVDGQVVGGIVQGIGTALYEEIPYNDQGQPLVATLADYLVPCAPEIPSIRIEHLVTPALTTEYGVKRVSAKVARLRRRQRSPTRSQMPSPISAPVSTRRR